MKELRLSLSRIESRSIADYRQKKEKACFREFHISRKARRRYSFSKELFSSTGNVVLAHFSEARQLAHLMNEARKSSDDPATTVRAGQLNAMGLIDEILHYVVQLYCEESGEDILGSLENYLIKSLGQENYDSVLKVFTDEFPPKVVYSDHITSSEYLFGSLDSSENRQATLEELLMLWLANKNPAFAPFIELFDHRFLDETTMYSKSMEYLDLFFRSKKKFGPFDQDLVMMLRSPVIASPDSLPGQLQYMRTHWGMLLGKYFYRLLSGLDFIKEEEKNRFWGGPGPQEVPDFSNLDDEYERFSPDRDWMPQVVLLAKSTLVWLDQLSKKYGRNIRILNDIPDEELDIIASRGFNALWLIGLWERSSASKRIKHICGNIDAASSAYSLFDYQIADAIGGWGALDSLGSRCSRRGIRLASDMVPNHTGIDSAWMHQHPDWFVQLDYPPFPSYSFNGENLSTNSGVGIYLEDHYYDKSDAAVVFKRVDFDSGHTRYIYHGNDGTHMPWNDTAQLNYLNAEVREAVIQTILHVARHFPIIRFDAAMTLAKRHIQRLWFPEPGSGGDIPSRAEHGMSRSDFNKAIPEEFWREVVDRVAAEVPDTLLLAEAFWMMEGYFVRSLGMHRVYNSAFMNMLKNEDNQKYRNTIKNTLEFDRNILKRFVNFMNNPDEETAIAQFGDGDKYFGVCTMMVTMPGLPLFGHGQIEGFTEKYGMEYTKAYHDETPREDLIERHRREIFPLMKKRYLFANVENFQLYDMYTHEGWVNENVFAWSNHASDEYALLLYNNNYHETNGSIKLTIGGSNGQSTLAGNLDLPVRGDCYSVFRNQRNNLWYIRNAAEMHEKGLFVHLRGYECQVFLNFSAVFDDEYGHYHKLASRLHGNGVPDINDALKEIILEPLYLRFDGLFSRERFENISRIVKTGDSSAAELQSFYNDYSEFITFGHEYTDVLDKTDLILTRLSQYIDGLMSFVSTKRRNPILKKTRDLILEDQYLGAVLLLTELLIPFGCLLQEWLLDRRIIRLFDGILPEEGQANPVLLIRILMDYKAWFSDKENSAEKLLEKILKEQDAAAYLDINKYDDVLWFNRERYIEMMSGLVLMAVVHMAKHDALKRESVQRLGGLYECWIAGLEESEYRIDKLVAVVANKSGKNEFHQ